MDFSPFEAFIYTAITPKFDSLLDVIKIEIPEEEYEGTSFITPYAMPFGSTTDFVKNNPMRIKISNCCIKDSRGLVKGNLEINIFKILELQQKFVPIFLKTSGFNGVVYMQKWRVERKGLESRFSADFVTTTILKPFDQLDSVGTPSTPATVPNYANNGTKVVN